MQTNFQKMEFEIIQAPDGTSIYLDIMLPAHLARVTVGRLGTGQGYCDTEIMDIGTEKTIHWQHQEFSRSEELKATLTDFFVNCTASPPKRCPLKHTPLNCP